MLIVLGCVYSKKKHENEITYLMENFSHDENFPSRLVFLLSVCLCYLLYTLYAECKGTYHSAKQGMNEMWMEWGRNEKIMITFLLCCWMKGDKLGMGIKAHFLLF